MASPQATTMTATQRAWRSFEIIENIVLFLPLRQLLLAQRINRATFDVIAGLESSPDIRRALFLKASAAPLKCFAVDRGTVLNCITDYAWRAVEDGKNLRPLVNPFLKFHRGSFDIAGDVKNVLSHGDAVLFGRIDNCIDGYACRSHRSEVPFATESRNKMLATHPPVGKLLLEPADGMPKTAVESDKGTTLGELFAYASSRSEGESESEYRVLPERVLRYESESRHLQAGFAVYFIDQAETWRRSLGVDGITGYEVLQVLDAEPDELNLGTFRDEAGNEGESEDGSDSDSVNTIRNDESAREDEYDEDEDEWHIDGDSSEEERNNEESEADGDISD